MFYKDFYEKNKFLVWGSIILVFTLVYNYWDKLNKQSIVLQSTFGYSGVGITLGVVIMILAIAVGIILLSTGSGAPTGLLVILGSILLLGAQIAGLSALIGVIFNFFEEYRFLMLIIGTILLSLWLKNKL